MGKKQYQRKPIFVTKAYKWQSDLPPPPLGALLSVNVLSIIANVPMEAPIRMAPVIIELYRRQ